jgi:hypothetical protein
MTLRDLTEEQRDRLMKECAQMYEMRNKSRRDDTILRWTDYRLAFSDGVLQTLKVMFPNV